MINQYETAACIGFARMGATCCQILEVFWYLSKEEIINVIKPYQHG